MKGAFITASSFSKEAARTTGDVGKKIVLIDGEKLAELMFDHDVGVEPRKKYEIKKIDEDFFREELQ